MEKQVFIYSEFVENVENFNVENQQVVLNTTKGEAVVEDTDEGLALVSMPLNLCIVGEDKIKTKVKEFVEQGILQTTYIDAL